MEYKSLKRRKHEQPNIRDRIEREKMPDATNHEDRRNRDGQVRYKENDECSNAFNRVAQCLPQRCNFQAKLVHTEEKHQYRGECGDEVNESVFEKHQMYPARR